MPTLSVQPRDTPEERPDAAVEVEVDEALSVHAALLEEWATPRRNWEVAFRQGHDFGRPNNVEARLLFVGGEQTSSLSFRLDQLDVAEDVAGELLLRLEEEDGIAKFARLTDNGLDVDLFRVRTFT